MGDGRAKTIEVVAAKPAHPESAGGGPATNKEVVPWPVNPTTEGDRQLDATDGVKGAAAKQLNNGG